MDTIILSGKYGLIEPNFPIPDYNLRVTKGNTGALSPAVGEALRRLLIKKVYKDLLICAGKNYLEAIQGNEDFVPPNVEVKIAEGGIGRKLSILHDWLYEGSDMLNAHSLYLPARRKTVVLKGIEICLTQQEILNSARQAIARGDTTSGNYQSWYVMIDTKPVAPKWLVSNVTGFRVSSFSTEQARRVLAQLGIKVERI